MVISDMSYLEVEVAVKDIEGGFDFSANFTGYENVVHAIQTASNSGPGGSSSTTSAVKSIIKTYGGGIVYLG
jgi:hypothetical protein